MLIFYAVGWLTPVSKQIALFAAPLWVLGMYLKVSIFRNLARYNVSDKIWKSQSINNLKYETFTFLSREVHSKKESI